MSQKYIKSKNNNSHNVKSFGKYYAKPVYDEKFIETEEIADFIQTQATLKRSDIKAALDELGAAMKHFLEMGQKIRLAGIGIFKVGFSSIGVANSDDCTANTITSRRVLFQPEIERIVVGSSVKEDGKIVQKYVNAKTLVKDVAFEEAHGKPVAGTTNGGSGSNTNPTNGTNTGGSTGGDTGGGDNNGGGGGGGNQGGDDI
jgi:predicted histone-like DNA-binding protein